MCVSVVLLVVKRMQQAAWTSRLVRKRQEANPQIWLFWPALNSPSSVCDVGGHCTGSRRWSHTCCLCFSFCVPTFRCWIVRLDQLPGPGVVQLKNRWGRKEKNQQVKRHKGLYLSAQGIHSLRCNTAHNHALIRLAPTFSIVYSVMFIMYNYIYYYMATVLCKQFKPELNKPSISSTRGKIQILRCFSFLNVFLSVFLKLKKSRLCCQ